MLIGIIPHDELEALRTVDNGYRAALHILSCPTFGEDLRVWRFVIAKPFPGIDFPTMLRRGRFSRYEKVLLRCAWSLFNGNAKLPLDAVACDLDADEIRIVIEAIHIRGGYR